MFYNFLSDYKFCKVVVKANFSSGISTLNAYQLFILQIYWLQQAFKLVYVYMSFLQMLSGLASNYFLKGEMNC